MSPIVDASPTTAPDRHTLRGNSRARRRWLGVAIAIGFLGCAFWFSRPQIADWANWNGHRAVADRQLDTGFRWFQRGEMIFPDQGGSQFGMARIERLRGRPDLMAGHMQKSAKAGFSSERLHREQLLAMAQSGQIRQIEREIPSLLMNPGDDGPAICEAIVSGYLMSFRLKEAMSILEAWQRDHPEDAQPFVVRGMYFAQRQTWSKAAEEFATALKMAPQRSDVRVQYAETLLSLHELERARSQFEQALSASPRNAVAHVGLGRCLLELGETKLAQHQFEDALKSDPKSWNGRFWLGKLLSSQGKADEAVPLLKSVCDEKPYEPDVRYTYAMALQTAGKNAEAQEHLQYVTAQTKAQSELRNKIEILERSPSRADLRYEIGKILLEFGNPQEGLGWLHSVLEIDPTHTGAREAIADFESRRSKRPLP